MCAASGMCHRPGWIQVMCSEAPQGAVTVRVGSKVLVQLCSVRDLSPSGLDPRYVYCSVALQRFMAVRVGSKVCVAWCHKNLSSSGLDSRYV
jgi:hypothetical protein